MELPTLDSLSNHLVHLKIEEFRKKECLLLADVILYLSEVDKRGIYRDVGYSSLYSYCVEKLKYSESAAYRRVKAARSLKDNPEIYFLIRNGKISLSALSEVVTVITPENKTEVLKASEGASKLKAMEVSARFGHAVPKRKDRVVARKVAFESAPLFSQKQTEEEVQYSITLNVDKDFMDLIEEVKKAIGPCTHQEALKKALIEFKNKRDKALTPRRKIRSTNSNSKRHIQKSVKAEVHKRDCGQCTFESEGHRCSETKALQYDHIKPVAAGGKSTVDNLRLRCPSHNQLAAERYFGVEFMKQARMKPTYIDSQLSQETMPLTQERK